MTGVLIKISKIYQTTYGNYSAFWAPFFSLPSSYFQNDLKPQFLVLSLLHSTVVLLEALVEFNGEKAIIQGVLYIIIPPLQLTLLLL